MLLHRVFLHDPSAAVGDSGHATYLYPKQGGGRWDNPQLYAAWYLATSAEGAVGETFGNQAEWTTEMFAHPSGLRRALATFSVPDDAAWFDFDDAKNLMHVAMRPTQVVTRNKPYTQARAAELFGEQDGDGMRRWSGVRWWSFHRPTWSNVMAWAVKGEAGPLTLEYVEELTLASPSVLDAARALSRPLP